LSFSKFNFTETIHDIYVGLLKSLARICKHIKFLLLHKYATKLLSIICIHSKVDSTCPEQTLFLSQVLVIALASSSSLK
jgi:hypothetical protein